MDSHVFRILALELKKYLHGARVEKIHAPAPGLLSITVYGHGIKRVLVMRHSKSYNHGSGQVQPLKGERLSPAIYLAERKLPNPEKPSTLVMTLRKYLGGRRLGAATIDWLNRRLFLPVPQISPVSKSPFPIWLCLDLQNGPRILKELPEFEPEIETVETEAETLAQNDSNPPDQNIARRKIPTWPDFGLLAPDHTASLQNRDLWRVWPVLTPALRKTLVCLEPLEAAALLADLEYEAEQETGTIHLYEFAGKPHLLSAWPLPPDLTADLIEAPLPQSTQTEEPPVRNESYAPGSRLQAESWPSSPGSESGNGSPALPQASSTAIIALPALEAARLVYEQQILASLGAYALKEGRQIASSEKKRITKSLQKLEQEEERLHKLAALREDGKLIQGALWRYAPDARLSSITVENATGLSEASASHDDCSANLNALPTSSMIIRRPSADNCDMHVADGADRRCASTAHHGAFDARTIQLDPLKTLRENMTWLFKQSDRGERGLVFIAKRRRELEAELALLESGVSPDAHGSFTPAINSRPGKRPSQNAAYGHFVPKKSGKNEKSGQGQNIKSGKDKQSNLSKLVQRFVSSDGFTMLRGRSAEGNWALLKLVQPHDIWLHVEGGPSAHVIIRRESLAQDIPRRTMLEAGTLSAVKSWRKTDSKAEIICALVKDVRPVKGGHPGSVLVDKIMEGFVVKVDPALETTLSDI